ncbi:11-beta-hydroxysteroid dehydrogenase-like 4A [Durio zibethinus]|uniref:11-beta-hydroxysteroid dehydrogenase-like 4A n=1 Tax=Durio zibethinus TaxID=66656 RepID=A0A6P5Y956_DURZI|nr:11-beta-hydroxysteroid dehydrogenase-like 4A [Durio zibethinus]
MEINKLLNIVFPPLIVIALVFIFPPFLVFRLLCSIQRFVFKENVAGKVVLITGASSGIGQHLAYEYAKRGARLALVARRTDRLQKVADEARQLGSPDVIVITADVSKIEDCKRFVDKTVNHFGQLDHLVNNAGVAHGQQFKEMSNIADFVPVMDINFWGSVYGTHFAVPHLRKSRGKIVVMSSAAGWLYPPKATVYSASKAAQIGLYESLRVELGPEIGITIVTPGYVDSEMTQGVHSARAKLQFLKNEPTDVCAKAIVESTCRGDMYLTEPFWVRPLFLLKVLYPELWDWTFYWLIVHGRTTLDKKL